MAGDDRSRRRRIGCVVALAGGSITGIGRGDQFPGARDVGLAAGAGEQPVVADAMEPLWQDVEQEAPDELVGASVIVRYRACPLRR